MEIKPASSTSQYKINPYQKYLKFSAELEKSLPEIENQLTPILFTYFDSVISGSADCKVPYLGEPLTHVIMFPNLVAPVYLG